MGCILNVLDNPTPEDLESIRGFLAEHNLATAGELNYKPLAIVLNDELDGSHLGGLRGCSYWGWLYVEQLAISPTVRGSGYGRRLLEAAEEVAKARSCHGIFLDTFSFQARGLYEKCGFEVFGQIDEFPQGHQRFYMLKRI